MLNKIETILVTGGCGFIGTNLVKYLSDAGYTIRVLDNLSSGNRETLFAAVDTFEAPNLIIGDIRDRDLVRKIVREADTIIHLAAHISVVESLQKPDACWDINVTGTFELLEACRIYKIKKFIFASSNAVLGEQPPPADEKKVPIPISPYGASKLAGEALCSAYHNSYGLNTTCLRFANCYGPHSTGKSSVIPIFLKKLNEHKPLQIYGDGNQTRDFVHVNDVCHAIELCIPNKKANAGEIFQIASGTETSINELVSMLQDIYGITFEIIHVPQRKGEIVRNYSNITKARQMLNYSPAISLKEGLRKLMKLFNKK